MQKYKLTIEYDGTPFFGWQVQDDGLTVQGELIAAIFRITGEQVMPRAAGRTDTGVHARGQVVHIEIEKPFNPAWRLQEALNAQLRPHPISVLSIEVVPDEFDARMSCLKRAYEYRIINRRAPLTLEKNRAWQIGPRLNIEAMQAGAQYLLGQHDFTTFRATQCQAQSPMRTLDTLTVRREGEHVIVTTEARAFLHSQVRSMVGSLVNVGLGKWEPQKMQRILKERDRTLCGQLAPPCGLYFMRADY